MVKVLMTFYVIIVCVVVTGYVLNMVKLANANYKAPYKNEIIRFAGLIAPVGAIVGYIDIKD